VRPAYRGLVTLAEEGTVQRELAVGTRAARLATELYPDSDAALGILGVLDVIAGDRAGGESLIRKAAALGPDGYVSPADLVSIANTLARRRARPAAIALLEIGIRLYPSDPALQARLAQLDRDAGPADIPH
jgi:predicted Zn-dependent protease